MPTSTTNEASSEAVTSVEDAKQTVVQSLLGMLDSLLKSLPNLAIALIVLVTTWAVSKTLLLVLRKVLSRTRIRGSLQDLFRQLLQAAIWVAGLLIAAVVIFPGVTPAKILTVLGLGSIAIGFAFKDIFENFFAGVLILWRFPFENNDFIEVDGLTGRVVDTTIRMTQLRLTSGELVILPNAHLFKNPVTILTDQKLRRLSITCGVAYGEDVDESRAIIKEAVESCRSVSSERETQIFAQAFGSSSIDFEITWWTDSKPVDQRRSRDEVVAAVKSALDGAGIEIPFPYRTLTFKEPLALIKEPDVAVESS